MDDILHLALSSCYENILKAAKIEIWEMTYDESNKQSDKKIYSVAKLNLKQEHKLNLKLSLKLRAIMFNKYKQIFFMGIYLS